MKTRKMLFYLGAALLGGCVPILSLHPLFSEKDVVYDQKLVGTWSVEPNGCWQFNDVNEPPKAYELSLTDNEGKKGLFTVQLVKLRDKLFMDVAARQFPSGEDDVEQMKLMYNAFFFIPAHTFVRVDSIEPELKVRWADVDKMKELLKKDPNAVRHEVVADSIVLTAPTTELQRFVLKYSDDRELFGNEVVLHRKKDTRSGAPTATDPNEAGPREK